MPPPPYVPHTHRHHTVAVASHAVGHHTLALHGATTYAKTHRNVLMAVAHDEQDVDMALAVYSVPLHATHVSVAASAYLWPTAHAVHVAPSLHASQPAIAEAQVAGAFEFR